MASSQSFSMIQRRMLLSPCPASPVKRELPLWTSAMRLPILRVVLHLAQHVGQETSSGRRWSESLGSSSGLPSCSTTKRGSVMPDLPPMRSRSALPALAVGRIGEHEVKLPGWESVRGERGAILYVVRLAAFSFQDEVGLANGIGLRVDLLAVQIDGDLCAPLIGELGQSLFGDGQHPAGAAGAVIDQVGAGADLISDGQEDEASHELHRRPLGVKCSPASSLFSSLKRRMSSSKTVPMPWLSRPSRRTEPSPFRMGLGLRLIELSRNFSSRKPKASASTRVGIWLRNLNFSKTSWTLGEKPSKYASKSARSR